MSKQLKPIPKFANDAEERAFWEKHDSTDYLDWTKAQRVVLPNLKPTTKTISLRLPQHLLDSIKAAANSVFEPLSMVAMPQPHGSVTVPAPV